MIMRCAESQAREYSPARGRSLADQQPSAILLWQGPRATTDDYQCVQEGSDGSVMESFSASWFLLARKRLGHWACQWRIAEECKIFLRSNLCARCTPIGRLAHTA